MTDIAARIASLNARRQVHIQEGNDLSRALRALEHEIEQVVRAEVKAMFPPHITALLDPLVGLGGDVLVTGQFRSFEGGGWAGQDPDDRFEYGRPAEGPMPWEEFAAAWQDFTVRTGIRHKHDTLKRRQNNPPDPKSGIRVFMDIVALHPNRNVQLVARGEVMYMGWDIPDHYIVVTIDGAVWAWWSMDAHGGPLEHKAKQGTPEWERFETFRRKP